MHAHHHMTTASIEHFFATLLGVCAVLLALIAVIWWKHERENGAVGEDEEVGLLRHQA
jgi:hypothetical protein